MKPRSGYFITSPPSPNQQVHLGCLERLSLHCDGAARRLAAAARRVLGNYAIEYVLRSECSSECSSECNSE